MGNRNPTKKRRPSLSPAAGGPAAGSGLNFQVDFAIRQALEAISLALADPIPDLQISMEPRVASSDGDIAGWDIRLSHPERVTEVKLRPKRTDILQWLDRVARGTGQDAALRFELSYGRGAGPLLTAIEKLCRIAHEADGDAERFRNFAAVEHNSEIATVLERLTTPPHVSLARVSLTPIDPQSLERELRFRMLYLVGEPHCRQLYEFLYTKFHKGIERRTTYHVRALIQEAQNTQLKFSPPPRFLPRHPIPVVSSAIYILQNCEFGLPTEVLAAATNRTVRDTDARLSEYIGACGLTRHDECWEIGSLTAPLICDAGMRLIAKALRQLLEFIGANRNTVSGRRQVANAIALAKACESEEHELVAILFGKLDKLLKRTGNKRLVLEVANISLVAARRPPGTETKTRGEAVALICGRAWVYQRINRLPEARADGEKSLLLGQDLAWHRNTAFCLKCLGRLFRMEAEQHREDEAKFRELLDCSIDYLGRATQAFHRVTELDDATRETEVGDCQSLLGRSHLVAGDLAKADAMAREASKRITDRTPKDYADLQILLGELAYEKHDTTAALSLYDAAIEAAGTGDAETSEIAARAYLQKGIATGSRAWCERAADIWAELEEEERADEARWHSMVFDGGVPSAARRVLKEESASIRVEAMRLHKDALEGLTSARGRRSEPDDGHFRELLPEARKNVRVRHVEW